MKYNTINYICFEIDLSFLKMSFENFDKSSEENDDYGHYCNLEDNYITNYHQKVYFYNAYAILTNNDKPSLYSVDYYYYPDVPNNKYVKIKTFKYEVKKEKKSEENIPKIQEKNYKKYFRKIGTICIEICMFSLFVSSIYMIMQMH